MKKISEKSSNGKKKNLVNEEDTIENHSEEKRTEKVHEQGEEVEKDFGKEERLSKDETKSNDAENIS